MKEFPEFKYINGEKSKQYRQIMNLFFEEYEKVNYSLSKQDVYEKVKNLSEFEEYDIADIQTDLDRLEEWKNLVAVQDLKNVATIEAFKNRNFIYSMSETSVLIERLLRGIEEFQRKVKNPNTAYISRIIESLEEMTIKKESKVIYNIWDIFQNDFKQINEDYRDYTQKFTSKKAQKFMKSEEFIMYKDEFVGILNGFINELRRYGNEVEKAIEKLGEEIETDVLNKVVEEEVKKQKSNFNEEFDMEKARVDAEKNILDKWNSFKSWFVSDGNNKSMKDKIGEKTGEIIQNIIRRANYISEQKMWGSSKKEDYKKFLDLFSKCKDLEECHKLSSYVFGIQNIRHFELQDFATTSTSTSVYEEGNHREYTLISHTKKFREKVEKSGFQDRKEDREKRLLEYKKEMEKNKKEILSYFENHLLNLGELTQPIPKDFRKLILNLITSINYRGQKIVRTDYGQYRVTREDRYIDLKCEDGDMHMPNYIFEFLED